MMLFGKFIDKFPLQRVDVNDFCSDDDYVTNYALCFIFLAILVMQMKDTALKSGEATEISSTENSYCQFSSQWGLTANMLLKCLCI